MAESGTYKQLIRLAEDLKLDPFDLEELVYDLVGESRAASYNSGEDDEDHGLRVTANGEADLEEWVDAFDRDASNINNGGLYEQVPFIGAQLGAERAESELRRIASRKSPQS